jgi:Immunoglobulin domain
VFKIAPPLDEPVWRVEPRDVSGEVGEEVALQCRADGSPPPAYSWYRHPDFNNVSTIPLMVQAS